MVRIALADLRIGMHQHGPLVVVRLVSGHRGRWSRGIWIMANLGLVGLVEVGIVVRFRVHGVFGGIVLAWGMVAAHSLNRLLLSALVSSSRIDIACTFPAILTGV